MLYFDLPDLKTSIQIPNISASRTLDTFEPVQSCRIKGLPFKGSLFCSMAGLKDGVHSLSPFHVHFYSIPSGKASLNTHEENDTSKWMCVNHPYCSDGPRDTADVPHACNKPTLSPAIDGLSVRFVSVALPCFSGSDSLILTRITL